MKIFPAFLLPNKRPVAVLCLVHLWAATCGVTAVLKPGLMLTSYPLSPPLKAIWYHSFISVDNCGTLHILYSGRWCQIPWLVTVTLANYFKIKFYTLTIECVKTHPVTSWSCCHFVFVRMWGVASASWLITSAQVSDWTNRVNDAFRCSYRPDSSWTWTVCWLMMVGGRSCNFLVEWVNCLAGTF